MGRTDETFYVNSVAWSPLGDQIALGGGPDVCEPDHPELYAIRIYDVVTRQLFTSLIGSTCTVTMVDWSPDGTKIVASSHDSVGVHVWDVKSGQIIAKDQAVGWGVMSVRWKPDATEWASGDVGGSVLISDALNGETLRSISTGGTLVDWNADGTQLVTGSAYENGVYIVDASTGQKLMTFEGHADGLSSVDWSPNGRYIASSSIDPVVQIWDASNGELHLTLTDINARYVRWSPNSKYLVTVTFDSLLVWDVVSGDQIATIPSVGSLMTDWSPDSKQLTYFDEDSDEIKIISPFTVPSATSISTAGPQVL